MGCNNSFFDDLENLCGGCRWEISWYENGKVQSAEICRPNLLASFSDLELQDILKTCIEQEEYEKACIYRDELIKRGALNQIEQSND